MNNQFAKIFTHKGNQVVLIKSTVYFMLNILLSYYLLYYFHYLCFRYNFVIVNLNYY